MPALIAIAIAIALWAPAALAGKAGVDQAGKAQREELPQGVVLDWDAGFAAAPGSASADLRLPSAEVARIKAERQAQEQARERLLQALLGLPAARWEGAPPEKKELEAIVAKAEVETVHHAANGSVSLRLRLKLAELPALQRRARKEKAS